MNDGIHSGRGAWPPLRLAWLINLYPAVTHTFIRREIEAVEQRGHRVMRVAHRRPRDPLPDERDRRELKGTRYLLEAGPIVMLWSMAAAAARRPARFARVLATACRLGLRSQRGLIAHLAYAVEAAVLLRCLRRSKIEHVHVHFGGNSAMVAMLCRMLGGPPFSFTVHGPQEFETPDGIHLREKIRACAFCIAISDFGAARLREACDAIDAARIHIVRCGVDAMFLEADSMPPPGEPRFLFIGRLDPQKNPSAAIEAIARLRGMGHQAELRIVGEGPLRAPLQQQVSELKLEKAVEFAGTRDSSRVLAELARVRALILPSVAEGLPVVIMEAFAVGRPVIASDVGGVSELLEHGVNGWLIPAGSVDALVEAMLESLQCSPVELHEMGIRGRKGVLARHDAARNAASLAVLIAATRRAPAQDPGESGPGA
jgi:glycosyltransferase involved in cell wall biosynthesis